MTASTRLGDRPAARASVCTRRNSSRRRCACGACLRRRVDMSLSHTSAAKRCGKSRDFATATINAARSSGSTSGAASSAGAANTSHNNSRPTARLYLSIFIRHGRLDCNQTVFDMARLVVRARLEFQRTGLQSAFRNHDAERNADQLGIRKHGPRAQAAIVIGGVDASLAAVLVQGFAGFAHGGGLVRLDRDDDQLERRNGSWPDDAGVVVALLDGGAHHAGDADTVAAHLRVNRVAVFIHRRQIQRAAVLVAELEYVTDLDALHDLQGGLSDRRRIARDHYAQVGELRFVGVAAPVEAGVVIVVAVGAGHQIGSGLQRAVGDYRKVQPDRADRTGTGTEMLLYGLFAGDLQRAGDAFQCLRLDVVETMIAAQHQ